MKAGEGHNLDLGQFFLEDRKVLQRIVDCTLLKKSEIVLEIGAGDGRMTKLLAEKAKKVVAVEIDKRFLARLKKLPKNVKVVIGDALELLSRRPLKKFDKIVANLPSVLVEPLFQKLTRINFKSAVVLVPEKFAYKSKTHPVFSAYYEVRLIDKVPKTAFDPEPRTNWEIVLVTQKPNPLKTGQLDLYLKQYFLEHPKAKVKNSLMEAIIKFLAFQGKRITKNQAREIIAKAKIKPEFSDSLPGDLFDPSDLIKNLSGLVH